MGIYSEYLSSQQVSQRKVAKQAGISPAHMNAIVKGKRRPSPKLAAKIEKITGIPLRKLLLPDEAEPVPKPDEAAETPETAENQENQEQK